MRLQTLAMTAAAAIELTAVRVHAQNATPADYEPIRLEQVIVTGTRIARPETEFPSPIVSFDEAAIRQSGRTQIADFLADTPALLSSLTNTAPFNPIPPSTAQTGINTLNLRNLGENRTLVLVDGRRHVPAIAGTGAVDVNSIPTDLIERVDVISGGASAIYGADAVSGAVNFITKKNFEGFTLRPQVGISQRGDAQTTYISAAWGNNFSGDRGNIALAYEMNRDEGLHSRDRPRYRPENITYLTANPADPGFPDDPAIPDNVPLKNIRIPFGHPSGAYDAGSYDGNGVFQPGAFDWAPDFIGTGDPVDPGQVLPNYQFSVGGTGTPQGLYDYPSMIRTKSLRNAFNLLSHFDVSPAITLFTELKYVTNEATGSPFPTYQAGDYISADNPFIPASIQPYASQGLVLVERDNLDFGFIQPEYEQETGRGVVGARGQLADWISYEAAYVYGQTKTRSTYGERYQDRYYAATDAVIDSATGQPTCRSNLDPSVIAPGAAVSFTPGPASGCVPFNVFGEGVADPASVAWVSIASADRVKLKQELAQLVFTGSLNPFYAAQGAGPGFAFGGEWRKESSDFAPDPASVAGLLFYANSQPLYGEFDVSEFFAEVTMPLLADAPGVHQLTLGAAGRISDYSTVGRDNTWKLDLLYMPTPGISLRGTMAQAVRAPNIGELFQGASPFDFFPFDPCDIEQLDNGSGNRAENCAALLNGLGVDPGTYMPNSRPVGVLQRGVAQGNVNLDPEVAETWTAGIVLDSVLAQNLLIALDWYDIEITDAITTPFLGELADRCVDQTTLDNPYCPLVTREDGTGYIIGGYQQPVNAAALSTSGADLTIHYRLPTQTAGDFSIHLVGGYVHDLIYIDSPDAEARDTVNEVFKPRYSAVADIGWTLDALSLNYGISWWCKTDRYDKDTLRGDPDIAEAKYLKIKERWVHDLSATYAFSDTVELQGGINNLLDEKPMFNSTYYPVEPLGRYFYLGARLRY